VVLATSEPNESVDPILGREVGKKGKIGRNYTVGKNE
jgi:hypothetical protein